MTRAEMEDLLRIMLQQHENNIVDRVEARIRRKAKTERRKRSPELVAQLAHEQARAPSSDLVREKARKALARLRERV